MRFKIVNNRPFYVLVIFPHSSVPGYPSFLWGHIHVTQLQFNNAGNSHANIISNTSFNWCSSPFCDLNRGVSLLYRTYYTKWFSIQLHCESISKKKKKGEKLGSFWNISMLRNYISTIWINTTGTPCVLTAPNIHTHTHTHTFLRKSNQSPSQCSDLNRILPRMRHSHTMVAYILQKIFKVETEREVQWSD